MKKLLALLLLVATMATAQTGRLENEPLLGRELSEVTWKIDQFNRNKMDFSLKGELEFVHHSDTLIDVAQVYQNMGALPERNITFTYHTSPKDHRLYINEISITGDRQLLIKFYAYFWNTTINVDLDQDGLIATNQYITDKIELRTGAESSIEIISAETKTLK
jgi:hypothetical protein